MLRFLFLRRVIFAFNADDKFFFLSLVFIFFDLLIAKNYNYNYCRYSSEVEHVIGNDETQVQFLVTALKHSVYTYYTKSSINI